MPNPTAPLTRTKPPNPNPKTLPTKENPKTIAIIEPKHPLPLSPLDKNAMGTITNFSSSLGSQCTIGGT